MSEEKNDKGAKVAPKSASKADAVLNATKSLKLSAKAEHKPLTAEQIAKIGLGRLRLAKKRGGGRAFEKAMALNAADVGLSVAEYSSVFESVIKGVEAA